MTSHRSVQPPLRRRLNLFLCLVYLAGLALAQPGWARWISLPPGVAAFLLAATISYGVLYLLPAAALSHLWLMLLSRRRRHQGPDRRQAALLGLVAIPATALTHLTLLADRRVSAAFGFHLNGFVWNLITTPGGLESMGMGHASVLSLGGVAGGLLLGHMLAFAYVMLRPAHPQAARRRSLAPLAAVFLALLFIGHQTTYAVCRLTAYTPVLDASTEVFLYRPVTIRTLARKMGFQAPRKPDFRLQTPGARLRYPLAPLTIHPPERPLNLVWLVAESWRADMLDPEIMPATSAFARQAQTFRQHVSGGNGTRMGLFTMFYGLYGSYWFPALEARRSPAIMDALQSQDYEISLYTSAAFSYPELDKTLFARIPSAQMHATGSGQGWQRDRANVSALLAWLEQRDPQRPFMTFMFFESPHAPYTFPPECAIHTPFLEDIDYITTDIAGQIQGIRNRYLNACRHLDTQFARVLDALRESGRLERTIVVLTGDHGEEFMERGHWGHNSAFNDDQLRVPLVLWVPGLPPREVTRLTSHVDLPATLLPLLGVENPPSAYSLGTSLRRTPHGASPWPRTGTAWGIWTPTTRRASPFNWAASGGPKSPSGTRPTRPTRRLFGWSAAKPWRSS